MKLKHKLLIIIAAILIAAAIPFIIFHARSPVLIVSDLGFVSLYGETRIQKETFNASLVLFRPVKMVSIADDAGDDIVQFAIADVSSTPYCVIFPFRFTRSARIYREQNPRIPVVILEGRLGNRTEPILLATGGSVDDYFIYRTDIENDFYKAALNAAALDAGKNGKIAVFLSTNILSQAREAFLNGINYLENPVDALFFTSFSQFSEISDLSCVVLAGAGAEYLENEAEIPVIFFSWIDPSLLPADVVLVVNDSPFVQAVQAVRMLSAGITSGQIQSKFQILNEKNIDRKILRKIRKMS